MKKNQILILFFSFIIHSVVYCQIENTSKSAFISTGSHLLPNSQGKIIGANNVVNVAPSVNEDFELTPSGAYTTSNAVVGWTVTSISNPLVNNCMLSSVSWTPGAPEFSIMTTPIPGFPGVGALLHSPLGGTKVARLNNYVNTYAITKISTNFLVTSTNCSFQFAFALFAQTGGSCCNACGLYAQLLDCSGVVQPCNSMSINPACPGSGFSFTPTPVGNNVNGAWTDWQIKTLDLTPYIGSCVTFECWCKDGSGNFACAAIDARCGNAVQNGLAQVNTGNPVNFCLGSGIAQISAPPGYTSYSWTASASLTPLSASQSTLANITITNPVIGGVYSVTSANSSLCFSSFIYTLAPTQVSILGIGSSPSCAQGTAGSATVQPAGSSLGYNYVWTNSSNSVISTNSTVSGLAPGVYTVFVNVPSNPGCGSDITTVTVQTGNKDADYVTAHYCGSGSCFLYAGTGSNFNWYFGTTAIAAPVGTAPNYTIIYPTINTSWYSLGYTSQQGCRDSTVFKVVPINTGTLSYLISGNLCPGTNAASVTVSFTPIVNNMANPGNSYTIMSTGATSPQYSYTLSPSPALGFTAANLTSGNTYSVKAFDGSCICTTVVAVTPIVPPFNISISALNSTLCSGSSYSVGLTVGPQSPNLYTYSWSPSIFVAPGSSTLQNIIISPTASPGTVGSVIYTVVVTPTAANCPVSATCLVNYANPETPTITVVPPLCFNSPLYTINVMPITGTITPSIYSSGIINATLAGTGTHTFAYSVNTGTCISSDSTTFTIYPSPTLFANGSFSVCSGHSITLTATGADIYLWNATTNSPTLVVNPIQTTNYSVTCTNTLGNCQATQVVSVTTYPNPTLSAVGNFTICKGGIARLVFDGANTFSWNTVSSASSLTLSPNVTTIYTLSGTDTYAGCSSSKTLTIKVNNCNGIFEISGNWEKPKIYPNPFSGNIILEHNTQVDISIYDNLGQLVYLNKLLFEKNEIDLSHLSDGIYYLKGYSENESFVFKLIKSD